MPSRTLPTRADSRTAKSEAAARAEQNLLDSIKFDDSQLDWVYENFERSPSAALAFLAANTELPTRLQTWGRSLMAF